MVSTIPTFDIENQNPTTLISQNFVISATALIIALILIYFYMFYYRTVQMQSPYDFNNYHVAVGYDNMGEALAMFSKLNEDTMVLLKFLRNKWLSKPSLDAADIDKQNIVMNLTYRYNPEVLYETNPRFTSNTSFTVYKGVRMYICMRQKDDTSKLVDYDVLKFVYLHELSHIGAYDVVDHADRFWEVFKFILTEAEAAGIYKPVDYRSRAQPYCGMNVSYNPIYDKSVSTLGR